MSDKLYDYADYIKLRLVINLYCSRQRTIMYSVEVQNGLYDTKRGRRKWGVTARWINYYCTAGRIPGAVKMATIWLIPKTAEKPIDGRTKEEREISMKKYCWLKTTPI